MFGNIFDIQLNLILKSLKVVETEELKRNKAVELLQTTITSLNSKYTSSNLKAVVVSQYNK
ncbi:CLUMA_CG006401, isoform A [Clunio marinus]|uniref:CLUMA_CG006401, isoform A n=1 Tax=Clunio marinus TaxID=568069 RepID=A0A1J1HXY7_9DIPT|nr:CLUMA_CG006401, isoform A [Clunio marinus]